MGVLSTRGLKNITIVETYHNNYSYYHLQYAVLHPWIKQYIAISETCGKEMKRRFHTSSKRMSVIPNGVDREKIRSIALVNPEETRQGTRYVTVGRLSFEKNITIPVKAFSNYCREGVEYIVIGDGPERDEVHKLAANNPYIILKENCNAKILYAIWQLQISLLCRHYGKVARFFNWKQCRSTNR